MRAWVPLSLAGASPPTLSAQRVEWKLCAVALGTAYSHTKNISTQKMKICAEVLEKHAFCAGDSGGPLVVAEGKGEHRQNGIISCGHCCGCDGWPDILLSRLDERKHFWEPLTIYTWTKGVDKPSNYLHSWARKAGIQFFSQNLLFFNIFHTKFKIEKYFTFWHKFCPPPILFNICVGDFMQNFRTPGQIKKCTRPFHCKLQIREKYSVCKNYKLSAEEQSEVIHAAKI